MDMGRLYLCLVRLPPNFASAMCIKLEDGRSEKGGVGSEAGNSDVQDECKSLDMTQDLSGPGNRIVVGDGDGLPSRILNSTFNDALSSSSERTPEASHSSSPSVSMHLRHVDRNLSPSPEPVLQRRLAPLVVANRTPSPSLSVAKTFPSDPPSLLLLALRRHHLQYKYYPPLRLLPRRLLLHHHHHIFALQNRMRMERVSQPQQQQPPQFPRGPTIYRWTEVDLGAADGPVPMIWSVNLPPVIRATAPPTNPKCGSELESLDDGFAAMCTDGDG